MFRYGGKFRVEADRMDKSAHGHDYIHKVDLFLCFSKYLMYLYIYLNYLSIYIYQYRNPALTQKLTFSI